MLHFDFGGPCSKLVSTPLSSFIIESKPGVWNIGPLRPSDYNGGCTLLTLIMETPGLPSHTWGSSALTQFLLGALFRVGEVLLCGLGDFQGQHLPVSP